MAYQIDRYNRELLTVVEDGTLDQTTDLRFIGKNYAGYGEIHNENFLFLLENFSNANPPPKALSGQAWYDSSERKLKFFDGTSWRSTGGSEVSMSAPVGLSVGDFWWDNGNDQLYVYNGFEFILIGPQDAGDGLTQMVSQEVNDTNITPRSVIVSYVNDTPISIFSPTEFEISDQEELSGPFDRISRGITLRDSSDGVTTSAYRFKGTATNADKLNNRLASEFVTVANPDFVNQITTGIDGMLIGGSFSFSAETGGSEPVRGVISNTSGAENEIQFKANNSNDASIHSVSITSEGIFPAIGDTFDLGSQSLPFRGIYASSFEGGPALKADTLKISAGTYLSASVTAVPNTIVARSSNNVIFANEFNGTATNARYADLAEKYTTDVEYPTGTVMAVGGTAETTEAQSDSVAIGVVSADPAFLMNSGSEGQALALKGRVPVRVVGEIKKGESVFAANNGVASSIPSVSLVGVALEDKLGESEGLVECVLKV
jgi:hypothetical protein